MKFSVIVPSYNQSQFIGETLDSIFSQAGDFAIECLVLDGGSTDNTQEVLKSYDIKVKGHQFNQNNGITYIWVSKKDNGQSDAINKGLKKSSGDIISYINSDDFYAPGAFLAVAQEFGERPGAWLTGPCGIVNIEGGPLRGLIARYKGFWLRHYSYKKLLILNFISQPATFWSRPLMEKCGYLDEALHYTMDYDYWLRLGAVLDPIIIKQRLANFRIHNQSKGETAYIKQFTEDEITSSKYSHSSYLNLLHKTHNVLIMWVYKIIK